MSRHVAKRMGDGVLIYRGYTLIRQSNCWKIVGANPSGEDAFRTKLETAKRLVDNLIRSATIEGARPELVRIAREVLNVPTLEERRSDRLDFHDLSVTGLRAALELAFLAGYEAGKAQRRSKR